VNDRCRVRPFHSCSDDKRVNGLRLREAKSSPKATQGRLGDEGAEGARSAPRHSPSRSPSGERLLVGWCLKNTSHLAALYIGGCVGAHVDTPAPTISNCSVTTFVVVFVDGRYWNTSVYVPGPTKSQKSPPQNANARLELSGA
jgi:hypothetical protein